MRREQLDVLTRAMPLAEDVHLDDVAARTPGFVAADLAALAARPAVRAALRQQDVAETRRSSRPTSTARWRWSGRPRWRSPHWSSPSLTLDDVGDMEPR